MIRDSYLGCQYRDLRIKVDSEWISIQLSLGNQAAQQLKRGHPIYVVHRNACVGSFR
jgi:hypothetical protein